MLSLFPEILFLAPFSAMLIRLALACIFAYTAWHRTKSDTSLLKIFGVIDTLLSLMLVLGFYTQFAAVIAFVCIAAWLYNSAWRPLPWSTVLLSLVMALSLLVTGAGPFAFDLPL